MIFFDVNQLFGLAIYSIHISKNVYSARQVRVLSLSLSRFTTFSSSKHNLFLVYFSFDRTQLEININDKFRNRFCVIETSSRRSRKHFKHTIHRTQGVRKRAFYVILKLIQDNNNLCATRNLLDSWSVGSAAHLLSFIVRISVRLFIIMPRSIQCSLRSHRIWEISTVSAYGLCPRDPRTV